jgi:PAS domain S-box-containing protein
VDPLSVLYLIGGSAGLAGAAAVLVRARRRRARQRDTEARFRALVAASGRIVWSADAGGGLAVENASGRTPEGRRGLWLEAVHPDDRRAAQQLWTEASVSKSVYQAECRVRAADGSYRATRIRAAPLLDDSGQLRGWVGMNTDLEEQRQIESALRESEDRVRMSLAAAQMVVWDWDLQTHDVESDRTKLRRFTESSGWQAIHPDDIDRARECVETAVATRGPYTLELRTLHPATGEVAWLDVRGRVVCDAQGHPVRITGTSLDVTERKRFETALRENDRRKDEFLATLAHELRNPLAAIRSAVDILRLGAPGEPSSRQATEIVHRQARQLTRLTDDLLDISRISRGALVLRRERVELGPVLRQAVEANQALIDASRHELQLQLPSEPLAVHADAARLTQIFSNLLHNAAKYTPPGGSIALTAQRRDHDAVVSVRDTGIGIRADMLARIFDLFAQGQGPNADESSGLGIGLTLARRLVELHGGTIQATSDGSGRGSEFCVRLPLAPDPPAQTAFASAARLQGREVTPLRLLIADDNRDAADALAMLLRLRGNEVATVYDGAEALESAARLRPDLALLDLGMPRLSGYEVARRVREQPWGDSIALVAVTGWGQEDERRRSHEAGFDAHLVKPVDYAQLEEFLLEVHRQHRKRRGD